MPHSTGGKHVPLCTLRMGKGVAKHKRLNHKRTPRSPTTSCTFVQQRNLLWSNRPSCMFASPGTRPVRANTSCMMPLQGVVVLCCFKSIIMRRITASTTVRHFTTFQMHASVLAVYGRTSFALGFAHFMHRMSELFAMGGFISHAASNWALKLK